MENYKILCVPYTKETYNEIDKHINNKCKFGDLRLDIFENGIYLLLDEDMKVQNFEEIQEYRENAIGEILIRIYSFNSSDDPYLKMSFLQIGETGHVEKISRKYVRDVSTIFFEG